MLLLTIPSNGEYEMTLSWIIRQNACVLAGIFSRAFISIRTSTVEFNRESSLLLQSITWNARCLNESYVFKTNGLSGAVGP